MNTELFRPARITALFIALLFMSGLALQATNPRKAAAAGSFSPRKLTLVAGTTDGGSLAGGTVKHQFDFTTSAAISSVASIVFDYCDSPNPNNACNAPAGLDVSGATLDNQSGATGFTVDGTNTDTNTIIINRTQANIAASTGLSYLFGSVINPSTINQTFFVRISTTDTAAGGGTLQDSGSVAASTAEPIDLTGYMPESLVFCTGGTVSENLGNVPDCSTATSGDLTLPDFDPQVTSYVTSQMAASTNAGLGYAITVNGATLTSGSNTIAGVGTADTCKPGTAQFALNLVANTDFCGDIGTTHGANITTPAGGSVYNGRAVSPYDTDGTYKFTTGDSVADSTSSGTDGQVYTVTYIVNVPGSQPAGTYTTTLTYICTPTF